ncbi:hypothetical protein BGC30_13620 [Novacetimonas hansenii]|nr:hypothetical protein BGC30_13620 [Novacetimonas hansenii]
MVAFMRSYSFVRSGCLPLGGWVAGGKAVFQRLVPVMVFFAVRFGDGFFGIVFRVRHGDVSFS